MPGAPALRGIAIPWRARVAWPHPEWWVLTLSAAAWLLIISRVAADPHRHGSPLLDWMVMIIAMMLPPAGGAMRATAARQLWSRRHRAIAWWVSGFLAPWFVAGVVVSIASAFVPSIMHGSLEAAAIAFAIAALYHQTPMRVRALRRCHATRPLAPAGWPANRDCAVYGAAIGVQCVIACGPLMIACAWLGHGTIGLLAMITITLFNFTER